MAGNMIEVSGLTKKYGDVTAVDDVSFEVRTGEVFGFLGPNGAGKSTTIKVLTTLLKRNAGTVTVGGLDPEKDADAVRRIIGYAAQEIGVDDDLTGRENLRLQCRFYHVPGAEIEARVDELLKAVDLVDAADRRAVTS